MLIDCNKKDKDRLIELIKEIAEISERYDGLWNYYYSENGKMIYVNGHVSDVKEHKDNLIIERSFKKASKLIDKKTTTVDDLIPLMNTITKHGDDFTRCIAYDIYRVIERMKKNIKP